VVAPHTVGAWYGSSFLSASALFQFQHIQRIAAHPLASTSALHAVLEKLCHNNILRSDDINKFSEALSEVSLIQRSARVDATSWLSISRPVCRFTMKMTMMLVLSKRRPFNRLPWSTTLQPLACFSIIFRSQGWRKFVAFPMRRRLLTPSVPWCQKEAFTPRLIRFECAAVQRNSTPRSVRCNHRPFIVVTSGEGTCGVQQCARHGRAAARNHDPECLRRHKRYLL